jgi:SAM-dependent methyltransferase
MLSLYEMVHIFLEPVKRYKYRRIRSDLKKLVRFYRHGQSCVRLLDVGARKSPYTIGINAEIVLLDLPRESDLQHELRLGFTERTIRHLKKRRSNICQLILEDIIESDLPDETFDIISAIDVIEHIPDDRKFVQTAYRLLKPGGTLYLTTINGLAIANTNPDHVRQYTRRGLEGVLSGVFDECVIWYVGKRSFFRSWGLLSWSIYKPITTFKKMAGNFINRFENVRFPVEAAHLFGICVKRCKG